MSAYCPTHGSELVGGPKTYTCPHGCSVKAADASNEAGRTWL